MHHIRLFFAVCVLAWVPLTRASDRDVILNEIMFDPAGSEYYDEFIEIYNRSDCDSVDLDGWSISDSAGTDLLVSREETTLLLPGQFGLILDSGYFENSTAYDPLVLEALILTVSDASLGSGGLSNSKAEPIFLISSGGDTVSVYRYTLGNKPGHSDEKIDPLGADDSANWSDSETLNGTPGRWNSVSRRRHDLSISRDEFSWDPISPPAHSNVSIRLIVRNAGSEAADGASVFFFRDGDADSVLDEKEIIGEPQELGPFSRDAFQVVTVGWSPPGEGVHRLGADVVWAPDEDVANNKVIISVTVGSSPVVVNEIMYGPKTAGPEWVELYNRSNYPLDLAGLTIEDADTSSAVVVTESRNLLLPGGYAVISDDSTQPVVSCSLLRPRGGLPSLNNDEETVVLRDGSGNVMDAVSYRGSWGGGSGLSLERINPRLGSADSLNWASSVEAAGHTAGRRNSIYCEQVPARGSLSASPNPFSPDGDGHDDRTMVSFRLRGTVGLVRLYVYDLQGRLLRRLLEQIPTGSEGSAIWDGRDDRGEVLPVGIYLLYLEAADTRTEEVTQMKKTVVLAKRL
jgi:hypothetical protein